MEENYRYALEEQIDYIMTIGTDQPVYTAAAVSARLNLPHPISEGQGRLVTNKFYMKAKMVENMIPTPLYKVFSTFADIHLKDLKYPLVMKPSDSQGQRGIFVLQGNETTGELRKLFESSRHYSPSGSVIFEEYCPGDEITVNCWVREGKAFILLITDRLHFDDTIALGICKEQRYPSQAAAGREDEIGAIVQKIVDAFEVMHGPLYIQMILNEREASIIEFGYRIGGGFESETIPRVTGIDILELYFNLVTKGSNDFTPHDVSQNAQLGAICFMLARPGTAASIIVPKEFGSMGKLFISEGQELGNIENATSRVGCFSCYTNDPDHYHDLLSRLDRGMAILNENQEDILIHDIWE